MEDVARRSAGAAAALGWAAALFWLVTRPGSAPAIDFPGADKLAHLLLYAPLGALLLPVVRGDAPSRGDLALVLAVALAHGAAVEWRQSHVPGRTAEALDVAADGAGALLGAIAAARLAARRARRRAG